MKIIVAVEKNWGIGYENKLLFAVREDMLHFAVRTTGKTVIMGGNTLRSLPGSAPLKNRFNIVLSRKLADSEISAFKAAGYDIEVARCINELPSLLDKRDADKDGVYIIGGAEVYNELLPFSSEAVVTKFDAAVKADAFFPNLDALGGWTLYSESPAYEAVDGVSGKTVKYSFCTYINERLETMRAINV
ncbi:MAG: dihydrofolate reductase [Clostridiales bacterium]|jgi:dihydrofolate reductase|nr:dihydrofolate reductase [Clostridiales bacterium]